MSVFRSFRCDPTWHTHDCNGCHTIIAQGSDEQLATISPQGLKFVHPTDIAETWREMNCAECHTCALAGRDAHFTTTADILSFQPHLLPNCQPVHLLDRPLRAVSRLGKFRLPCSLRDHPVSDQPGGRAAA